MAFLGWLLTAEDSEGVALCLPRPGGCAALKAATAAAPPATGVDTVVTVGAVGAAALAVAVVSLPLAPAPAPVPVAASVVVPDRGSV